MGFFQGVVQQLNVIDERNERYGKELRDRAEKDADRAERRKERQEELARSRIDALTKLVTEGKISQEAYFSAVAGISEALGDGGEKTTDKKDKKAALEVPKPDGKVPTPYEKKLPGQGGVRIETTLLPSTAVGQKGKDLVKRYNLDPEKVAKFVARGPTHIDDLIDLMKTAYAAYKSAGREAEWTPKVANEVLDQLGVYADEPTKTLDRGELDRILGLNLDPIDKTYYAAIASAAGKPKTSVANFYTPPTFFTPEEYDKLDKVFVGAITQNLINAQVELQRFEPTTDEERTNRANGLRLIEKQLKDAKEGIITPDVIESYGPETFMQLAELNPKILQQKVIPGNLGAAQRAYKRSQNAMPTYDTVDEARAARERGEIKVGDSVVIAGQTTKVKK